MTTNPLSVDENTPASKALSILNENKITSLLVYSGTKKNKKAVKLKGIVHIHNLLNYGLK